MAARPQRSAGDWLPRTRPISAASVVPTTATSAIQRTQEWIARMIEYIAFSDCRLQLLLRFAERVTCALPLGSRLGFHVSCAFDRGFRLAPLGLPLLFFSRLPASFLRLLLLAFAFVLFFA